MFLSINRCLAHSAGPRSLFLQPLLRSNVLLTTYTKSSTSHSIARLRSYSTDTFSQTNQKKKKGLPIFRSLFALLTAGYLYDTYLDNAIIDRTVNTLYVFFKISVDYKMNFTEENQDIEALHERNAQRLYDLLVLNKGLYIKIGQMIAIQGMMFPKQYQDKFSLLFDKAPRDDWKTCDAILKKELGQDYKTDLFEWIDEEPVASASIAQVHKAKLKTGELVAVKIQHSSVSKQVNVDLMTYKFIMGVYAYIFEMPLASTVDYICGKMKEEVNFNIEMNNGNKISKLIQSEKQFRGKVYVPFYYPELSTNKVLTAEWIDADSVGEYLGLRDKGYNIKELMTMIVKVYSRQVFVWGLVHCDLHPGNLLVRKIKVNNKTVQQLVILDHGLYEHFNDKFRREYSEFWKFTMESDSENIVKLLSSWGIKADDIMVGLSSMNPNQTDALKEHIQSLKSLSYYQRQLLLRNKMREFLQNTDKFPMTLIFIMRSMRIVQGLNRNFDTPCNRIDILATEANNTVKLLNLKESKSSVVKRYVLLSAFRIVSFIQFNYSKLVESLFELLNTLLRVDLLKVSNLEDYYENQMIQVSKGLGFEDVPTTNDLMK